MLSRIPVLASIVVIMLTAGTWLNARQQSAAAKDPDILNALLVEVRGLRAAMEQMAATGPRVQLAFGRLQLQEQRVSALIRRHEVIRDQIEGASRQEEEIRLQVKRLEEYLRDNAAGPGRADMEQQLPSLRREAARLAASLESLQNEDSTVSSDIATEQARWTEINRLLEDLDRSLARSVK